MNHQFLYFHNVPNILTLLFDQGHSSYVHCHSYIWLLFLQECDTIIDISFEHLNLMLNEVCLTIILI
jgi:hypothetical protein